MSYYLYWLWHRLTCTGCYDMAPVHLDSGRGLLEATIIYLAAMLFLGFIGALVSAIMEWS